MRGVSALRIAHVRHSRAPCSRAQINRWLPIESMRYYFQLNNAYVVSKLKVLLLPFRHRVSMPATLAQHALRHLALR
jgi:hypothetical protein